VAVKRNALSVAAPPTAYDPGVKSQPVVQLFDDCVPRTAAKILRKRIVLQHPKTTRDLMPWPSELSARWGYWNWLDSINMLGVTTQGTDPYKFLDLMNDRGWCAEEWMPYLVDGGAPAIDSTMGPPLDALSHAYDQRGKIHAHILLSPVETRVAIAGDLGVGIPFACDERIVSQEGIPHDPDYVWDFAEGSPIKGWHMIEPESYDERGVLCQNTWGADFGAGGYVRIGWTTLSNPRLSMPPVAIDWVPQTSEEVAAALAE
jgi:hypothetical protein